MKTSQYALSAALCLAVAGAALAQQPSDPFKRSEEGWFWYQVEPEPKEPPKEKAPPKEPKKPAPPTVIQLNKPKPQALSVEWFQKEYPKLLNTAVDDPTDENVQAYRYATRVMLDKASNFTRTFQKQSLLDPLLDESVRSPFANAMRGSFQRLTREQKTKATEKISKKAGLWVFLDEKCVFCSMQYPIIARTAKERGFEVIYITPDGERPSWLMGNSDVRKDVGQSKHLKIQVRPALALVVPPEKITVLSQGMISQDLIEERILIAGDAAGLIDGQERKDVFPEERGIMTTEDIKDLGKTMADDPKSVIRGAQEKIQKRY